MSELTDLIAGIARDGLAEGDVGRLRAACQRDGSLDRSEAGQLLSLDRIIITRRPEAWSDFLAEAIADYVVHQERPAGYVSDENASWLRANIAPSGRIETTAALEAAIRVVETARLIAPEVPLFLLDQIAEAIETGDRALLGAEAVRCVVPAIAVDHMRRILHAPSSAGSIGISRDEAAILFAINDATAEEMNDPSWDELFVKAVANFALSASGYVPPSRAEALSHDAFFDQADADLTGFFRRMVAGLADGILHGYKPAIDLEAACADRNERERLIALDGATINESEARWIAERIGDESLMRDNERAVLSLLKREAAGVHPALKELLARVA